MIHLSETGRIADGFYCLGHPMVPAFVLDGDNPVMFEAGVCAFGSYYMKEIERHLGERRPGDLFITHMHYDHCGAAGYMKKAIPGLRIGASEEAAKIIEKPSAVDLIARLNGAGGLANVRAQVRIARGAYRLLGASGSLKHCVFDGGHRWDGAAIPWMRVLSSG